MNSKNKNSNDKNAPKVDPLFARKPPKKPSFFSSWQFQSGAAIVITTVCAYAYFILHIPIQPILVGLASLFAGIILLNIFLGMFID